MKRSEMVDVIFDVLDGADGAYTYGELSEMILNKIEEAGMLPTKTIVKSEKGAFHTKISTVAQEWEPEVE